MQTRNYFQFAKCAQGIGYSLLIISTLVSPVAAHNLDQIDTAISIDDAFVQVMLEREELEENLIQDEDEFWLVFRSTPGPGTDTGVGGYLTFYIPTNYVEVLEVSYLTPSPGTVGDLNSPTNFTRVPLKGQSIIAIGSGTIGPATTTNLIGLTLTNAFGQAEDPVTAAGVHRGTIAGVYADTGVFYSEDPRTEFQSWAFAPETGPLSRRGYPVTMVNNRGESITPITRYDAEQLIAYGRKDVAPVVDPNGRGSAPWGLANVVAGPDSGYAWDFDLNTWLDSTNMPAAVSGVGPWQRIRYPGSQYAQDQAGLISSALGYAGVDASNLGFALGVDAGESPLPVTANAVRISYGMLELGRPEYAGVRIRVKNPPSAECFTLTTDAFGGDAGGEDGGKDHEWRYYDPTIVTINPCTYLAKTPSDPLVRPGDTLYFTLTFVNNGMIAYTNVVLTDTLPDGLTFLSADPPQDSGPNPLVWDLGTVGINEMEQLRVYVRTTSVGTFRNVVVATSGSNILAEAVGVVEVTYRSLLRGSKTVTPQSVAPGGTVAYSLVVYNEGTGPNGVPLVVNELLPPGFTFVNMVSQEINGLPLPESLLTIDNTDPNRPTFTLRSGIEAGNTLELTFNVLVDEDQAAGDYCNAFFISYEGKVVSAPPQACVTVGGGRIGDAVYRDWNGNGTQDVGEEGLSDVTVNLYTGVCPVVGTPIGSADSDSSGTYAFAGLEADSYCVSVDTNTAPEGYVLTTSNPLGVTLELNQVHTNADFGFLPGGTGSISARVFNDQNGDGADNDVDSGITNITVWLYEDSDGNGQLDSGDLLLQTTTSGIDGAYSFLGLAEQLDYLLDADESDADLTAYFNPESYSATTPDLRAVPDLEGEFTDAGFGYRAILPSSIGDMVFIDLNNNGTYETNDVPLPDITVSLHRGGGGGEPLETCVSDMTGHYLFSGLAPNTYLIEVDATDPDLPGGLGIVYAQHWVTLAASSNYLDADFAFQQFIGKSVDKAFATTNELLTYTIEANYPGAEAVDGARVIDPFPAGITFSNATAGGVYGPYASQPGLPGVEQADPVELVIGSVADTFLQQDGKAADDPHDVGKRVQIKTEVGKQRVGLMRFDFSEIPAATIIESATFTYYVQNAGTYNSMSAYRMLTEWVESEASWEFSSVSGGDWASADTDFGTNDYAPTAHGPLSVTPVGWKTNDVTHLLKEWVEDGQPNYGMALMGTISGNSDSAEIYDREDAAAGLEPRLAVIYKADNIGSTNTLSVSRTVMATGETVTVTLTLWASETISNVTPMVTANSALAGISGPAEAVPADVPADTPTTFTFTCTPQFIGELVFEGEASSADVYDFIGSRSASVLVSANGSSNVVSWTLGTNTVSQGGATASGGTMPGLYVFQGKTKAFWHYSTLTNVWSTMASVADNTDQGAALAYDGTNTIYALRGGKKIFWSYSLPSNTWSRLQDVNDDVKWGGALVYLDGYVYAFRGDDKKEFWRYDPAANTWSDRTDAPEGVKEGGALTTDGTSIYALRGKDSDKFWTYDVEANTWSVQATVPAKVKRGGALTYLDGYIYAFRGGDKTDFWRYSIVSNAWTTLTSLSENVDKGGSLATDGTYVYGLNGDGTAHLWRYNPSTGIWTKLQDAPGNVGDGGALVFVKGAPEQLRQVSLFANRSLVSSGSVVTVSMEAMASTTQSNLAPSVLTVTVTNGATATLLSGPTPTQVSELSSNTVETFTWTYQIGTDTNIGTVSFSGTVTNSIGESFGTAVSGSVIVMPPLVFQGTVDNPISVNWVENTAIIRDLSGAIPPTLSETVYTALAASIGDRVWVDVDGDGLQEAGEPGLADVTMYLKDGDGAVLDTVVTDASGLYHFYGLATNVAYTVVCGVDSVGHGYLPSTPVSLIVTLTTLGEQYTDADFGLQPPGAASIDGRVWLDADEDGTQDAGESGVSNLTVQLYLDVNTNGTLDGSDFFLQTALTGTNGTYVLSGLRTNAYLVQVDGASLVSSSYGGSGALSNAMDFVGGVTPHPVEITTTNQAYTGADFGYNWCGQIGDRVWWDDDRDGLYDAGEEPISHAYVLFYCDVNSNGVLDLLNGDFQISATPTSTNGLYLFSNLPPGHYLVDVYEDSIGLDGPVPTTPYVQAVDLGPGESYLDADFGYYIGARVEGHAFWDANRNRILEYGEAGLTNVTVYLDGVDMYDNPVILTNVTDILGHYLFVVPEGNYSVSYAAATVWASYPLLREPTTATNYAFHAYAGDEWHPRFDFGVDNAGRVGDTVFGDIDSSGTQSAGEPGLQNVMVVLYDTATNALDFVLTDLAGHYQFIGLDDGTYLVQGVTNTLPSTYLTVPTADPTAPADSWGQAIIVDGGSVLSMDFGYPPEPQMAYYTVSGTVYKDINTNGALDGGEVGITNITVDVAVDTNSDATADFFYVVETGSGGTYSLAGIPSNSTVTITLDETTLPDAAYYLTGDPDGAPLTNIWTVATIQSNAVSLDFGYFPVYGSLAGYSCIGDGDGYYTPAQDTPLALVGMTLRDAGLDGILGTEDDVVLETLTAQDGSYGFTTLPPGYYSLTESAVAAYAYLDLADADGGDPNVIYIQLARGDDLTHQDFENTHWLGTAGPIYNAAVNSSNEYIWTDKPNEQRVENTNAINDDIRELRMFANDSNFYIRVTMDDIRDERLPYIAIGVDTRLSTNSAAMDWLGDDSGLYIGGDYFDGPAPTHYPVRNIIVHQVAGTARAELFAYDGYAWYPPPSGWSAAIISTVNDGLELRIPRADLMLDGGVTGRFTVASFLNTERLANEGDSTVEAYPGTADAADSVSIAPLQVNDGQLDVTAWREDISDYDIDFWVDVRFDANGLVSNALPSTPAIVSPTNGAEVSARPTLCWQAASDSDGEVTGYFLEASTNQNFNGAEGSENGLIALRVNLPATQTNYVLSTSATQYWWRVRARDQAGMLSDATVQSFHIGGKTDVEGPVPTLLYVGTNLTGFLSGNFDEFIERYGYIDSVTDEELAQSEPMGFAARWDDPSGVFSTNWMNADSTTPGAFAWNILPEDGRVSPNWDVDETNAVIGSGRGWVTNQWFWGSNVSAVGNSAITLTNWVHAAFAITNFLETTEYYLKLSAEDSCEQNGYDWDDGTWNSYAAASLPEWGGYTAEAPNTSRNVTTNYPLRITMRDDDFLPPVAALGQAWASSRSMLASNSAAALNASGLGQMALYQAFDGMLITNSLTLLFNAQDFYSGVQISSNGPPSTNTTLSVGFGSRFTTNYANYSASHSLVSDTTQDTTVLAWHWSGLTTNDVNELWGGDGSAAVGVTNPVRLTLWDNDHDRPNDQAVAAGVLFGQLQVLDDDLVPPVVSFTDIQGRSAQNYYTDSGEVLFYDFGTASPADLQPARGFPSLSVADLTLMGDVPTTATTGNPGGSAVYGSGWTIANQSYWEWSVTVDPGFQLNLQKVSFASRSTSTGPVNWILKNSADGFTAPLASGFLNNDSVFESITSTDLVGSTNSGAVTYRLYGIGASSGAGTWRLDNVSFTGKVSSISGSFLATDSDLKTNGLALTASVQDPGSGVYGIQHADYRPVYSLISPVGTSTTNQTFGAGPDTDGAGRDAAATLSATNGFAYADIVLGVYTAIVSATDYDVDRLNDRLSNAGSGDITVVDDDTEAPRFSSLRGTYLTFNGISAGSEANAVTDGMLTNGLSISNRVYDEKSGVLGASMQFLVQDPVGWSSGWEDFTSSPADGEARTNKFLPENTVWVEDYTLDLENRALGVWTTRFYAADCDADRPNDALATTQSFAMFVIDDDVLGPRMTNFFSQGAPGSLIATSFEVIDGWVLHTEGDWTEEANDGTWTATSTYVNSLNGRGGRGYNAGFNAVDDALQLPPVDQPGWLILWAKLSAEGESRMVLERWNGATWDSLGERAITTEEYYEEYSWPVDGVSTGEVLRLRMTEKTTGDRSIYFDDLVVAPNRDWTHSSVSLAWGVSEDASTGNSGLDEYRVVGLGGTSPLEIEEGTSVGLDQSAVEEPSAFAQGVVTGYVVAVDADQDRGAQDRAMGLALPHVQRMDITPPTLVHMGAGGTNAVTTTVEDPTTQFDLGWNTTDVGPDDPGHVFHPTGLPADRNLLSPWRSYKVYYGSYNSTRVPLDDIPTSETTGYIYTNFIVTGTYRNWLSVCSTNEIADPSAPGYQPNYTALTNQSQNQIRLYDLDYDQDYVVVVVGVDKAGNEGPAGIYSWATNSTIRFALIRGRTIPWCDAEAAFPECPSLTNTNSCTAAALYWIAAGVTNEQGGYTEVKRDYDLISWDSSRFEESSNNLWQLVATIHTNWLVDDGGHYRGRGNIRFYRASYKDRWKDTNALGQVQRPMASEEVYALHNVVLSRGPNFVALHGEPYVNSFQGVFGGNENFPGGFSAMPASGSTLVEFYTSGTNAVSTEQYFLSNDGSWFQVGGGEVTTNEQAADFFTRGFAITLPDTLTSNYVHTTALDYNELDQHGNPVEVPAMIWSPILEVPTNGFSQTISTGSRFSRVQALVYNVAALRLPVAAHPDEMRLLESGFQNGNPGSSDEIYTINTATKSVLSGSTIYCDAQSVWRFVTGNGLVPQGYFKPNDVIVIVSRNGGVGNHWTWTYHPDQFYDQPTRWMGQ
jgi:uncharacterized repeat protein (TIGR01451 family)